MNRATGNLKGLLLMLAIAVTVAACSGDGSPPPEPNMPLKGVKGDTLRIVNVNDVDSLDPAVGYSSASLALMRLYARTLYSWDSNQTGDALGRPVPDLADRPPTITNGLTYSFTLRKNVRWADPVNRDVVADDFIFAVERQVAGGRTPLNPYIFLIKGVREFSDGKAKTIAGLESPSPYQLRITLEQPAPDFLSIVSLPLFAPVPRDYVTKEKLVPGDGQAKDSYARAIVGSGPYTLESYAPGQPTAGRINFKRNENWDPKTDPLRAAWVDRVEVTIVRGPDNNPEQIQELIEQGDADLNGDGVSPPAEDLPRITKDLKDQYAVRATACTRYLSLQLDDGPTAELAVRQALNYAVDKSDLLQKLGGPFAGNPATTILTPPMAGYVKYDLYASPEYAGDTDKAKALLRSAGYTEENGYTPDSPLRLTYVGQSTGQGRLVTESLRESLARVGIQLVVKEYPGNERYRRSLQLDAKKAEHQLGYAFWCPDWPSDSARSFIATLLDGRAIKPTNNNNFGNYNSPEVNKLIDQALAEPNDAQRAALWSRADRTAMEDAAWVPLLYVNQTFFWSDRVRNWRFSPWVNNPDYANLWIDKPKPAR
jgi:peptide/nickel transport system substrate-binding protein